MALSMKHDAGQAKLDATTFNAGFKEIYLLGLGLALGGCVVSWNQGLENGFFTFLASWAIIATLYLCLILCLAELNSIVAFAGGSYGFVRCSISPFMGYLSGCSELIQNNFFVICSVASIGANITDAFQTSVYLEPLWFFLTYMAVICWHLRGGRYFWYTMCTCAAITIVIIMIYCLVVISDDTDYFQYDFTGHSIDRMQGKKIPHILAAPMWMFLGNETITIAGAKIANGKDVIPKAALYVYFTLVVLTLVTIFCVYIEMSDDAQDELLTTQYPMNHGFLRFISVNKQILAFTTIIPNYATALGFMFASKHLTHALALSGLFSPWFKPTNGENKIPVRALLTCFTVQFLILILMWTANHQVSVIEVVVTAACFTFFTLFCAYVSFNRKFSNLERGFVSPLGDYGAYLGMLICCFLFISVNVFQNDRTLLAVFYGLMFCSVVYYFLVAEKRQFFSQEEQKKFMKAYILNANKRKKFLNKNANMNKGYLAITFNKFKESFGIDDDGCLAFLDAYIYSSGAGSQTKATTITKKSSSAISNKTTAITATTAAVTSVPSPKNLIANNKVFILPLDIEANTNSEQNTSNTSAETSHDGAKDSTSRLATTTTAVASTANSPSPKQNTSLLYKSLHHNSVLPVDNNAIIETTITDSDVGDNEEHSEVVELEHNNIRWSGKVLNTRASRKFFEIVTNDLNDNNNKNNAECTECANAYDYSVEQRLVDRVSKEFTTDYFQAIQKV